MEQDFYPLCAVPVVPRGAGIRFLHPKEQYDVDEFVDVIWFILGLCSGYFTSKYIVDKVTKMFQEVDQPTAESIIEDLANLGVIVDSREAYRHFHQLSTNPMSFQRGFSFKEVVEYTASARMPVKSGETIYLPESRSPLNRLQAKRRSCRSFSEDKLDIDALGHILTNGYSLGNHSTPSAGGLYPLKIYVIVTRDQTGIEAGYYEYNPENNELVHYNSDVDVVQLQYAFDSDTLLYNAPVIIVIAADLERQNGKYSNRGYRYILLEAGHVAQNMQLASVEVESKIATLEYGGFLDNVLADELWMDTPRVMPITTIAVGKPSDDKIFNAMTLLEELENEMVGHNKPIRFVRVTSGSQPEKGESFFGATALYAPSPNQNARKSYKHRFAGGTASSSWLAKVKALAEAYERYASAQVRVDLTEKASNLKESWLDPRIITPLSAEQYQKLPFLQVFDPDVNWQWVRGVKTSTGQPVMVPVDLVFYPMTNKTFDRKLCFESSSSGVAAFTTQNEAVRRGILELIERDSIMRSWFERKSPERINLSQLPLHWQRRAAYWEQKGRNVFVLDLSNYGVVTIIVVIQDYDQFPCFVSGAASSEESFDEAVSKAFHEAELGLIHAMRVRPHKPIDPDHVSDPGDHAKLYALPDHISNLEWLWQGKESDSLPEPTTTIRLLLEQFEAVIVQLSNENSPLKVVRVLSEKLVPITFGKGRELYLHHSIDYESVNLESLCLPHHFA